MDPRIKNWLIEKHGLKADATDAEATVLLNRLRDEGNVEILDLGAPAPAPAPAAGTPAPAEPVNFQAQLDTVKASLDAQLAEMNQKMSTLNIQMHENVEDDPALGYKSRLDFFNDVIKAGQSGTPSDRLMKAHEIRVKNAVGSDEASVSKKPDGGFLIPPAYFPETKMGDPNVLQTDTGAMTMNVPMSTDKLNINARVDKNHSSSVTGGLRVYRRAEAETVTASKMAFEQVTLSVDALMGLAFATDEILSRSPISFAALIEKGMEQERVSKMNAERLRGTGVGEYLGVLNAGNKCLIEVAKETGQTATTINGTNILKMKMRCYGYNNAVWMANQDTELQLTTAHIALTKTDYIKIYNPEKQTLLGRPVIFDENCSTLGTVGDLGLYNWNEYLEGQLGGSSFAESVHVRFEYNETAFKFNIYNAGAPWWRTVLTPKNSASTLSPFVVLATRS